MYNHGEAEKSFDNTSLFTYKKKQAERLDEDNIKFLLNLDYNVKNYYLLLEYNKKRYYRFDQYADLLKKKTPKQFTQKIEAVLFDIFGVLTYLHKKFDFIYKSLKLDNIIIEVDRSGNYVRFKFYKFYFSEIESILGLIPYNGWDIYDDQIMRNEKYRYMLILLDMWSLWLSIRLKGARVFLEKKKAFEKGYRYEVEYTLDKKYYQQQFVYEKLNFKLNDFEKMLVKDYGQNLNYSKKLKKEARNIEGHWLSYKFIKQLYNETSKTMKSRSMSSIKKKTKKKSVSAHSKKL